MAPPESRSLRETRAFIEPLLAGRRRVLDVGCGRGELAAALARAGHEVTALDVRLPEQRPSMAGLTFHEAGFLTFDARPFDAILFVTSLHHIAPLGDAVEHARRLLVPGGLLIAEEFSLEAPDAATARWYFDTQELLAAAGRYPASRITGDASMEPLARWVREHEHEHAHKHEHKHEHAHDNEPLSEGWLMREEVARRMTLVESYEGPFLYRYISAGVAEAVGAEPFVSQALTDQLFESERRGIAAGVLKPVGLRLVARCP